MLKKEFEFVLQDTLIYSHEGKAGIIAKKLLLRAPTTKLLSLASKLSATVMAAFIKAHEGYKDNQTKTQTETSSDVDGASIFMLVSGSIDSKRNEEFIETIKELLLSDSICLVDGKEQMTLDLFNSLDSRETLRLIGDYIANFLLPSIMSNSKKKS